MKTMDYPYKPKPRSMAVPSLLFGVIALLMAHTAITNDRGLVLNGIVHLSMRGATILYGCVAAFSGLLAAFGIEAIFLGFFSSHRLVFDGINVSAPRRGMSRYPTVIPVSSITGIDVQVIQRQRVLNILHKGGKLTIMQSLLPSEAAFDAFAEALLAAVKALAKEG